MVAKLLSKLFGSAGRNDRSRETTEPKPAETPADDADVTERTSPPAAASTGDSAPAADGGQPDPAEVVNFLVRRLAVDQNEVQVDAEQQGAGLHVLIHCSADDMGRIIGKKGKTISAIRHLAMDVAARSQVRLQRVEVAEP